VHPGPMKTNSEVTARINKLGFWGEVSLLSPERVAEISVRQLFKRNVLIILTRNRLSWLLLRIVPNWIMLPLFSKIARSQLKK
jgi:short-subunit dehydrogenase